ncbi:hypothetical protein CSUI_001184 [Cystoisospora suis]|uniref:Transmembrane protein n=1 Tax=Cystoisospora suis TaxID=483139 RepID=A0A2C6LDB9_9APIC|nr:hypothetical protein CSUI_001184 [Cystoisospora suis]
MSRLSPSSYYTSILLESPQSYTLDGRIARRRTFPHFGCPSVSLAIPFLSTVSSRFPYTFFFFFFLFSPVLFLILHRFYLFFFFFFFSLEDRDRELWSSVFFLVARYHFTGRRRRGRRRRFGRKTLFFFSLFYMEVHRRKTLPAHSSGEAQ